MIDRVTRLMSYLYWRRRLGWFAKSAYLGWPDLIVNAKGISLDWGAAVKPHARLECQEYAGKLGHIEIGEGANIQFYFHCAAAELVKIGQNVLIAGRVYVSDHDHTMPWQEGGLIVRPVTIGHGCWLGEGCCVLKGVELGPGCIVGANAVVTHSAPAYSVLVGVPARIVEHNDGATRVKMSPDAIPPFARRPEAL